MNEQYERDRMTDDYDHVGRVTCQKLKALMDEGWLAPFAIDVTGAHGEQLFTAEYDGNHHFTSADGGKWLLPEMTFPVAVCITDAGGQSMMMLINAKR
jgi:hypothetical protein